MCAEKLPQAPLVKQEQALNIYFDGLLSEPQGQIPEHTKCAENKNQNDAQLVCDSATAEYQHTVKAMEPSCLQGFHFQVLFFEINNLLLATPLRDLSRTIEIPETLVHLPDQPPWVVGMVEDQGDKIILVDVPFLFTSQLSSDSRSGVSNGHCKVLVTKNRRWGIPCNEVSAVSLLNAEDVKWRRSSNTKSWLLGMVTEKLCALIDLNRLILLQSSR